MDILKLLIIDAIGINIFLDGYITTENLRFRQEALTFRISENADDVIIHKSRNFEYPNLTKTLGGFKLEVEGGGFSDSEIVVLVGENGMGKTTFVQMLAGKLKPDNEADAEKLQYRVSLKPQTSKQTRKFSSDQIAGLIGIVVQRLSLA